MNTYPSADPAKASNGRTTPAHVPTNARTYTQRAYAHLLKGEYDRAEIDYRMAVCLNAHDPDVKESLSALGRVLGRLGG